MPERKSIAIATVSTLLALALCVSTAVALTPAAGPSHCRRGGIRSQLVAFAQAYDRGDTETLDGLFAQPPSYQWYSAPAPGRIFAKGARGRASLLPYFTARHAKHDSLKLVSFSFNGNSPRYGNFEFTVRRSTEGFRGGRRFSQGGKGAAVCDESGVRFIVLTFGQPGR